MYQMTASLLWPWRGAKLTSFLVDLDGGLVGLNPNDFSDQIIVTDTDKLVHGAADHVLGDNDGTVCLSDGFEQGRGFDDIPRDGEDRACGGIAVSVEEVKGERCRSYHTALRQLPGPCGSAFVSHRISHRLFSMDMLELTGAMLRSAGGLTLVEELRESKRG